MQNQCASLLKQSRFPQTTCKILEPFGISDIELLPMSSSPSFGVYGEKKSVFLQNNFPQKNLSRLL